MLLLKIAVEKLPPSQRSSLEKFSFSKLDLCEGGSFSTAIFNSDIQLSVYSFLCFVSVCPLVALLKATYAENSHTVFVLSILKSVHF